MMNEVHEALLKLQELDQEIREAERRLGEFEPLLEQVDEPVLELESEVAAVRNRLEEMRSDIRRLERAAEEKRERQRKYQDHLDRARNAREEAAAHTELDLVRKAADADEGEALGLMESATRLELKLDELERKLDAARAEMTPRREEILADRQTAREELDVLADRRTVETARMNERARRLYEQVRGGRTRSVLSPITADGACGHCFSLIPLQQRTEVRRGSELIRCEACGIILYSEE